MHSGTTLDPLYATRRERLDLCEHLDTLTAAQWQVPSLCRGWTVKDVVAHLTTSTRTGVREMVVGMIRVRRDFDRMERERAVALSGRFAPEELVAQLRDTAWSPARAPFTSPLDPLLDVLVHGQDITRPLGQHRPMDPPRAVPALEHALVSRWYGAGARLAGLHLRTTDITWSTGDGRREVAGPITDLLLVATGRAAGLANLQGSGVALLTERLASP